MFDVLPLIYQFFNVELSAAPFYLTGTDKPGAGSFPTGGFAKLGATSLRSAYIQPIPPRNYVMQWNLDVQRELARNLTFTIGYVVREASISCSAPAPLIQWNQHSLPRVTSFPHPLGAEVSLIPTLIKSGLFWGGESTYHAMELGLEKKIARGLQVQVLSPGQEHRSRSASLVGDTLAKNFSASWI